MKLTPLDIHHKEFHRAIRGYNEEEVDLFLDQVYSEFERIFKENNNLKDKVEQLESKVNQFEGIEQTLQNTLVTAQKSAEDVQLNAKKEADLILKDAEMKARQTIEDAYNQRRTLTNSLNNLKAIEEEFINHIATTVESFKSRAQKVKNDQGAVEKRIAKELDNLPEMDDLGKKNEKKEKENNNKLERAAAEVETTVEELESNDKEAVNVSAEIKNQQIESASVVENSDDDKQSFEDDVVESPEQNDISEAKDSVVDDQAASSGSKEAQEQPSVNNAPDYGIPVVDNLPPTQTSKPEIEGQPADSNTSDYGIPEVGDQPVASNQETGAPEARDEQLSSKNMEMPKVDDRLPVDSAAERGIQGTNIAADSLGQQAPIKQNTAELTVEESSKSLNEGRFSKNNPRETKTAMSQNDESKINFKESSPLQDVNVDEVNSGVSSFGEEGYKSPFAKDSKLPSLASDEAIDKYLQQEEPAKEEASGFLDRIKSGFRKEKNNDSDDTNVNSS